jgi:hypothetical protein
MLSIITGLSVHAQSFLKNADCVTNPPDLSSLSYEAASAAVDAEEGKRTCPEYVTNLVRQLLQGNLSRDKMVLVIYRLGELRPSDTNSIAILITYIDLKATKFDPKARFPRWGYYPAEEALMKIGSPALIPILNDLPRETNPLRRHLMCEVLIFVEGKRGGNVNQAEGRKVVLRQVQVKLGNESDPVKRVNLELVLKKVEGDVNNPPSN